MRRLQFLLLFVSFLFLGLILNRGASLREIYKSVCDLTNEHFYRVDRPVQDWVAQCYERANRTSGWQSTEHLLSTIQEQMNEMGVSHFAIYNPEEDRRMWKGESIDTGIRSRFIEDHLVVYRVFPGSAAAQAQVMPGDDILTIEGAEQLTPWGAQHRSGKFTLRRQGVEKVAYLKTKSLVVESAPQLTLLNSSTGLLVIPSFRSEFFARAKWHAMVSRIKPLQHMIVDIRENPGGNFVAMLRALSPFLCSGVELGQLLQLRKKSKPKTRIQDNTEDEYQIQALNRYRSISLSTFKDYGCYSGAVTVLIGSETASVSEIFAESMKRRARTRVWGQPTAGDVVVAVWYDLPYLGPGFSVSIPEAVYVTPDQRTLEGHGVVPQRELFYELTPGLRGEDNWLTRAVHEPFSN